MSTDVKTVTKKDNIFEVACMMRDQNVGMIPVVEDGDQLVGVITDRDIVIRGVAEKRPNSLTVDKIMSSVIASASADMSVEEAAQLMGDAQVRRLPIVENHSLVGIVSLADIAQGQDLQSEATHAISEISETHNPKNSNDISPGAIH